MSEDIRIYDDRGGVYSTIRNAEDPTKVILGEYVDQQVILDHNAVLRSENMERPDSWITPVGSYHPIMPLVWCQEDGISYREFMLWPQKERLAYLKRKVESRDYRKFMTQHKKGLSI
tara:strand:- start:6182 stop:6532 length:351 start_codon:yes stop_codon:yes gene_type:complete